jgi:hypothetical protein
MFALETQEARVFGVQEIGLSFSPVHWMPARMGPKAEVRCDAIRYKHAPLKDKLRSTLLWYLPGSHARTLHFSLQHVEMEHEPLFTHFAPPV